MSADEQVLNYPIPNDAALDPPAEWAELRGKCPVAHVTLPSGDRATLLTRYEDVKQVLADPRFTRLLNAPDAARLSATEDGGLFNSEMATIIPDGGEEHQHWRRLVGKWFTAKRMNALRPVMAQIAEDLIDDMVRCGAPGDLKASLGFPLPVYVICDMLGVPAEDRDRFSYWSDTLLNLTRYGKEEIEAAQAEFFQYMSDHLAAKRSEPGEDLLSELIAAGGPEDGGLNDLQILVTGMALLVAGHETTANMIGKMVSMLLADRSRWEALLADPSLIRTAVEESLRLDANSGFGLPRYLKEETEVSGEHLPKGTTVICSMAAANRDVSAFEDAERFDLTRSPNPHLAFGAGAHSCLGQALARTELQVVLEVLLRKLPSLELAVPVEELERVEGLAVGGLRTVPVRW
ncbi:cytochrome P450 [Streptosporangium roseum]|uniref:Cytochrome P450 n=1 Tax=Streptosporangium roseum (strain ATCC 12428 / DSM 43021 / JCM 3005 / KCTC 9067 / NCIMB 10171 / NRRL 2505 / NI 9100) TaxID=479432 RepID=D2B6Z8_STRRD|nr:cytochrome P450 [Streptosporangium roseum]ACZ87736.1 putative cytochrome P450 [Streptosporangium roseum DSM 43021]